MCIRQVSNETAGRQRIFTDERGSRQNAILCGGMGRFQDINDDQFMIGGQMLRADAPNHSDNGIAGESLACHIKLEQVR